MDFKSPLHAVSAPDGADLDELWSLLRAEPLNLAAALANGVPRRIAVPGSGGLIYPGKHHLIAAERGHGKTLVSSVLTGYIAQRGGRVLYLDRENGPAEIVHRIATIADAEPTLREAYLTRLDYVFMPSAPSNSARDALSARMSDYTLVVVDSYRAFLSSLSLDPDAEKDIARFVDRFVAPIQHRGVAVLILDNTGHNDKSRPKDSATKMDAAEVVYMLERKSVLRADLAGSIELRCTRSRFGDDGCAWTMDLGAGNYSLPSRDAGGGDARENVAIASLLRDADADVPTNKMPDMMREHGIRGVTRSCGRSLSAAPRTRRRRWSAASVAPTTCATHPKWPWVETRRDTRRRRRPRWRNELPLAAAGTLGTRASAKRMRFRATTTRCGRPRSQLATQTCTSTRGECAAASALDRPGRERQPRVVVPRTREARGPR